MLSDVKEAFDAAALPLCSRGKRQEMSRRDWNQTTPQTNYESFTFVALLTVCDRM